MNEGMHNELQKAAIEMDAGERWETMDQLLKWPYTFSNELPYIFLF